MTRKSINTSLVVAGAFAIVSLHFNDSAMASPKPKPSPTATATATAAPSASDSWQMTSTTNAPLGRYSHVAVWDGSKMIVWGGYIQSHNSVITTNTGGMYDPVTNSWTSTSTGTNTPTGTEYASAVWTGSKMIVWGGADVSNNCYNTGGLFDPSTNSWSRVSSTGAPAARKQHGAAWTGSKMFVYGGTSKSGSYTDGGLYNPSSNTWSYVSASNGVTAGGTFPSVLYASNVNRLIVWGGLSPVSGSVGGLYDPAAGTWTPMSTANQPVWRMENAAVFTGNDMIVFGGFDVNNDYDNDGASYDPSSDSWTAISSVGAPSARRLLTGVWSGSQMIVYGGTDASGATLSDGGKYDPASDSWAGVSQVNSPEGRWLHTAVSTGSQMIVFGGDGSTTYYDFLNSGGIYTP